MANTFDVGDGVRVTATFSNFDGAATDPAIVNFLLKDPVGSVTTPTVHQKTTGVYYADFVVNRKGTWAYRWEGSGALDAAQEGTVLVRASNFS